MSTGTPVACVNASISFTKASSSDCTKYFQRSIESLASFSGFHGAACAQARAHSKSAGPVSAPAAASAVPPWITVRRVKFVMVVSSSLLCVQSFSRRFVEQMDELRIGFEPDLVARLEIVALAEDGDDVVTGEPRRDLDFGSRRLDDDDLARRAVIGKREMFGPDAIDSGPPVGTGRLSGERKLDSVGRLEGGGAVRPDAALAEIHRRRADE